MQRTLDILVPSYNRPAKLHALLKSGLALDIPGAWFVVIDDGSTLEEDIPGVGRLSTEQVCAHFGEAPIVYIRNPENRGLAHSWTIYYTQHAEARYAVSVVDKDQLIDGAPLIEAIAKLEANPAMVMVFAPLLQHDMLHTHLLIDFQYETMEPKEFLARFVRDENLMHAGGYAIKRVAAIKEAGLPRSLGLREFGLEDMFGIDIDLVLMLGATGTVGFVRTPYAKRSIIGGGTAQYPLTFAYSYYQYAKRAMEELLARGMIGTGEMRQYLGWWQLMLWRGLVTAYRPIYGSENERGDSRIRHHLKGLPHRYVRREMRRVGVTPTLEMKRRMAMAYGVLPFTFMKRFGLRLPSIRLL